MLEDNDLSPWAHPKAQRWFATLLERSGFINEVEDTVNLTDDHLELAHCRMLLALLILLGRPGIWPEDKNRVLQRAASKINNIAKKSQVIQPTSKKAKPLSIEQHKRNSVSRTAIQVELELLRRRAGISNRKSKLPMPSTWGKFWS